MVAVPDANTTDNRFVFFVILTHCVL